MKVDWYRKPHPKWKNHGILDIDDMEFDYNLYDLSDMWMNSRFHKKMKRAIIYGDKLESIEKMSILWNKWLPRWDIIVGTFPLASEMKHYMFSYDYRYYLSHYTFSWTLPSQTEIDKIIKYSEGNKILDIGCGTGIWSRILSHYTEIHPIDTMEEYFHYIYVNIEEMTVTEALDKYSDYFIILNWPRTNVIQESFNRAPIGTRFYINQSFAGMNFYIDTIEWIVQNSKLLDYTSSYGGDGIEYHNGIIVEKVNNETLDKFNLRTNNYYKDLSFDAISLNFKFNKDKFKIEFKDKFREANWKNYKDYLVNYDR